MRIIAGTARGRNLLTPANITRPTSDRAREGIFSSLTSELGTWDGVAFLDLFAGTGAVGLEALSRGAEVVESVEKDPQALQVCRDNFEIVSRGLVELGKFRAHGGAVNTFIRSASGNPFNVIFLDPPYEFTNEDIENILTALATSSLLAPAAIVVVERPSRNSPFAWPAGFTASKERKYGEALVYFASVSL